MRAFNYISPVGLEGEPNLHYKPFQQYARPSKEQDRPVERPLYAGMIVAQANGEWRSVGTTWLKTLQHYIYVHCTPRPDEHRLWIKTAMFVDEEITNLVIERLRKTFDPTVWEQTLAALEEKYVAASSPVIAQRSTLERVMQNYLLSLKTLDTPEMIQQVEADYKAAQEEHKRLSHQLRILSNEAEWLEALRDLKKDHDPAIANWENLTRNQRRVVLHGFIDRIEAEPIEERALQFTVYWKNGESNTVILTRQSENGWQEWLQSDVERLLQIVDRGASQIEITQAFPKRTWKMIKMKVESIRGAGSLILSPKPMYEYETYEMYIGRVGLNPPTYQARSGDDWTPDEVKQLLELIDNGASRVELAAVFPHRKWGRIRFKITRLRGKNVPIPGFGTIRREETIDAYRVRLGEIEPHGESTQHIVSFDPSQSMHNYAVESRKRLLA